MIEITEITLKRLGNYETVVQLRCREVEKLQWRVMTLEVMQQAAQARAQVSRVSAAVAYARHLHALQNSGKTPGGLYGEPLLSRLLAELMEELQISLRAVSPGQGPPVQ